MDTNETEGFFPERRVLRARRLRAVTEQPADVAEVRTRGMGMSVVLWVAVFIPMFVSAVTSGWNGHMPPGLMEAIKFSLWLILVACALCAAVGIWRNIWSRAS